MKTFNAEAMAAIETGTAIVQGAVWIGCDPEVAVWGGYGTLTIEVDGTDAAFLGVGSRGMIVPSAAGRGGAAQGLTLTVSGIDPEALALLEAGDLRGAPVIVYRLIFSGVGYDLEEVEGEMIRKHALLDHHVFDRGRVDLVISDEAIGGAAAIKVQVETSARGLGRKGGRMRSDADQRLVDPDDGFFKHNAYAGQKLLHWGGKPPAQAGSAVGGSGGGGGGGGAILDPMMPGGWRQN